MKTIDGLSFIKTSAIFAERVYESQGAIAALPAELPPSEENLLNAEAPPSNAMMGGVSMKSDDFTPTVGRIAAVPDATKNCLSDESPRQRRK